MLLVILNSATRIFSLFFLLVFWCCMAGCNSVPSEYRAFFDLSAAQRKEQMEKFPINKQIEFFLAGETYGRPPLRLGEPIAKKGKEAVPFLLEKLGREDKEFRQLAIINVLEEMNKYYYNLKDEKDAIKTVREVAVNMKNPQLKAQAEQALESISNQQMLIPRRQ